MTLLTPGCSTTISGGEIGEIASGPDAGPDPISTDDPDASIEEIEEPDASPAGPVPVELQGSSSNAITPGNSISCNTGDPGFFHVDSHYYRVYDLSAQGISGELAITSVEVGIEEAVAAGGTQNISVNLHSLSGTLETGTLVQLASATLAVADQGPGILSAPMNLSVAASSTLVVEVFTPSGEVAGNRIFLGSNAEAESSPSFILAAACNVTAPQPISSLGVAGLQMSLVLNIKGEHIP